MHSVPKISVWQLFAVLLLSRLLTLLTYTTLGAEAMQNGDYFPSAVFSVLFILLFSVMLFVQMRWFPKYDLVDIAYYTSPIFSKIISVLYAIFFLFTALETLARLELFVSTVIFPSRQSAFLVIICVVAACYAASLGVEALGRTGAISLGFFVAVFLFIMLAMADKIDFINFSPLLYDGVSPSLSAGLAAATRSAEIMMFSAMLPQVTGNTKKAYGAWLVAFLGSSLAVFFFVFGGLGYFALTQLFPIHAIAVLSELSVFQRFDVLLTGIWILSAFVKISFLLYLVSAHLQKSFRPEWKTRYLAVSGILIAVVQIFFAKNFSDYFYTVGLWQRTVFFAVFAVALPAIVLFAARKKRGGNQNA